MLTVDEEHLQAFIDRLTPPGSRDREARNAVVDLRRALVRMRAHLGQVENAVAHAHAIVLALSEVCDEGCTDVLTAVAPHRTQPPAAH